MALSWNEIKSRAIDFSREWENAISEDADAKSFWDGFFNIFGVNRRRVATFEYRVVKANRKDGYIDLLWKGVLLVEHKSAGKNLDMAFSQAVDYFPGLKDHELPKYICVSNFHNFRLIDLDEGIETRFELKDLLSNVQHFGFLAGYIKRTFKDQEPINVEAAYRMGKLHDALKEAGYSGQELEKYLVRILFCLFAQDTAIFNKNSFQEYIEDKTNEDGSDLGLHLAQLFQILNTEKEKRQKTLDESLNEFPYINGNLFEDQLSFASFNSIMRKTLLECCNLDWSKISPAIFGSMFQSVMDEKQRRNLGAYYTSEKNILKLIKPLFLDNLWKEFEDAKFSRPKLNEFHQKIASLRFLDPACGCGNFLIIAYREIRELELALVKHINRKNNQHYGQQVLDVRSLFLVDIDKYYGIEIDDFATQIAQVAMWMIDHQMNLKASWEFGKYFTRIPLNKSAHIVHGNALQIDWDSLLSREKTVEIHAQEADIIVRSYVKEPTETYGKVKLVVDHYQVVDEFSLNDDKQELRFDYIFGNPPFIGKQMQSLDQKRDMDLILNSVNGSGVLDYVCAWYIKAAQYLKLHNDAGEFWNQFVITDFFVRAAFVSTNSISQGEQVGVLWNELFNKYNMKIHFAHRTFKWGNEAKYNAAVHVIIIGYSNCDIQEKLLYEYDEITSEPVEHKVKNINPYLVEGKDIFVISRVKPICSVPDLIKGSETTDNGHFMLTDYDILILKEQYPDCEKFIRPFIGGGDFINGKIRHCLWLKDANKDELNKIPFIADRINKVRIFREASNKKRTNFWSKKPHLFTEDRQPVDRYLMFPKVSSEKRQYIPFAFVESEYLINNTASFIPNASIFHFGVVESEMHMSWMRYVCGRMKSDFIYSNKIVYNNFPWPENPTDKQIKAIEKAAQRVLDVRAEFPNSSLADLYDPLTMPPALVKGHQALDKAVDGAYRKEPFANETKRIEFLFELYEKYTAGLFVKEKVKRKKK
ncbi:MAG: class I SAM-dependent DNA methyltransferase [Candidatus Kapabacteria bacterium]|nr:class I SAM-dependent DNA methyltransferase [Candidatus Kapabacteria bacterium]